MAVDRYSGVHGSSSPAALAAFEDAVDAVAAHRPDAADALQRCLDADADMVAAHVLKGLGAVMLARQECLAAAATQLAAAQAAAGRAGSTTRFEAVLLRALEKAVEGDIRAATALLDAELDQSPKAFLIAKLAHGLRFMAGDAGGMLASTTALLPAWSAQDPGYGYLLGCHAFALEENGEYAAAERAGRQAVLIEPRDAWGMHAVAHVYEMQGRSRAGIGWLTNAKPGWQDCHNFRFHMAWHLGLFLLEEGRTEEVLDLYDHSVRPECTDDVRDIANATSMLWRLRQEGVHVGGRWEELAEIASRRRQETILVFATLHQLLALVARGERAQADDLLSALARAAACGTTNQSVVARRVGLPLARLMVDGKGEGAAVLALARRLHHLGGSHAQRDVFLRILLDHAASQGDTALVGSLLDLRHQWRRIDRFASRILPARLGSRVAVQPS
ncbi:MAG TPA: tetratricopeptide repeat protein [Geminicoccus sp.]|uniref:tetratricopeptide repeat protein n=1 Tax=Geminicoccus sp. TaxID=2024832 RepID=UPI002E37FE74|nr:tetratricopeptide repeat protein [Geminicoccus sp.]HEX2526860.1 tetratricopeptide repeat protein [Geminicoccus sp.]